MKKNMKKQKNLNMGGDINMDIDEFIRNNIKKNEEEAKKILQEKNRKTLEFINKKSGISKRFRNRTFENFIKTKDNNKAIDEALSFVRNFKNEEKGLLFTGTVGTGKTHIASSIANYLIDNFYKVIFGNVTDIILLIKNSYSKDSNISEFEIIQKLTDVDLLVIDDLGKENSTDNTITILYCIINKIYESNKPIIVTTNLSGKQLQEKYKSKGRAIVSRLSEMTKPIIMQGKDWRLRK